MSNCRQNALAFLCGIAATLTLPPFFVFPLLIPAYGGLYLLVQRAPSRRQAFIRGWWWGWGFYITGLYWFCIALLTEPDKFAWLIPFALFGLTAVIAVYSGIASLLYYTVRGTGIAGIVLFATLWTLVEYARGYLFTGFPWNLPGYALGFSDISLQLASLAGAYGLSWLAVILGAMPAAIVLKYRHATPAALLCYAVFIAGCGWGALRLQAADAIPETERYVPGVMLRLVQANIAQHHKWNPQRQFEGLKAHIDLTRSAGGEHITHVIWPETAVPYAVKEHSALTRLLGEALPKGALLITGGLRSQGEGADWHIWNSIMVIDATGEIVGSYEKHKLVPFGEFLPFRSLIPASWLTPVGMKDFDAGPGPQTLSWPGLPPLSPLLCYEAIFPELAVAKGETRPQALLNLTNDAWFGTSSGPYQHFHMARMRAVEQGIPIIRVANTGISAVIDLYGRIVAKTGINEKNIIDTKLPNPRSVLTIYIQVAKYGIFGFIFLALSLIIWQRRAIKN